LATQIAALVERIERHTNSVSLLGDDGDAWTVDMAPTLLAESGQPIERLG
jgi:hypothetical protein